MEILDLNGNNLTVVNNFNVLSPKVNIDFGDFGPVAKKLFEKISGWVGLSDAAIQARGFYIKNILESNLSDLDKSIALANYEDGFKEQARKAKVLQKSFKYLKEDAKPDVLSEDWTLFFFDKVRIIEDEQLQDIWARILAGEVNQPGLVSKKTMDVLQSLGKEEAELFVKVSSFVLGGSIICDDIDLNEKYGIKFENLLILSELGLLNIKDVQKSYDNFIFADIGEFSYLMTKDVENQDKKFTLHGYVLTSTGKIIFDMIKPNYDEDYLIEIAKKLITCNPGWSLKKCKIVSRNGDVLNLTDIERIN